MHRMKHGSMLRQFGPRFHHTVASLTANQRRTYFDYFERGYNAREIAEMEGISRAAITRRVGRIRDRFRAVGLPEPSHIAEGRRHDYGSERMAFVQLSAIPSDTY
jgi:hypothetical protein